MQTLELTTLPESVEAMRTRLRAFLEREVSATPAATRARSWMRFDAAFSRKLAAGGWLGLTLPKAYGGQELGAYARFLVSEELLCAGAPVSAHWIADRQSGPLILRFGTDAQRAFYLPRISRGEAFFCIGMSEPNSGSDLASIRTRAVPNDQGWALNGSKIWTTYAHKAHYMIALVRTDGDASSRHEGLSQFIIDLSLPGVTVRPIQDASGDAHFSEVFFDNVQLGADALIGERGQGWAQVNAELAFERSGPERIYSSMVLVEAWIDYLRGEPELHADAAELVGELMAWLATLRAMSLAIAGSLAQGGNPVVEASLVKDLGTELEQDIALRIAADLARHPDRPVPAALLETVAYLLQVYPTFSLRGGTREILRGIIARGLGLR